MLLSLLTLPFLAVLAVLSRGRWRPPGRLRRVSSSACLRGGFWQSASVLRAATSVIYFMLFGEK